MLMQQQQPRQRSNCQHMGWCGDHKSSILLVIITCLRHGIAKGSHNCHMTMHVQVQVHVHKHTQAVLCAYLLLLLVHCLLLPLLLQQSVPGPEPQQHWQ
jgi:hypothetical protein